MDVIEVHGLIKRYGTVAAVDGVELTIQAGEFFGVLGPNGAGKTTLLELVEGLREPDGGTVRVFAETPWPRNPALLPRLGVQLQASAFFEQLSAREQLQTFADLYGVPRSNVQRMLDTVGLRRRRWPTHREAERWPEAAPLDRDGAGARPPAGLPRRAKRASRPAGPAQPLGTCCEPSTTPGAPSS